MQLTFLWLCIIGTSTVQPQPVKFASGIRAKIWRSDKDRDTCPDAQRTGNVKPYVYCVPQNTDASLTIPLTGLATYYFGCSEPHFKKGTSYSDYDWYAGAPPTELSDQGNPYNKPWSSVFIHTRYPKHIAGNPQWPISDIAKQYQILFPKMTITTAIEYPLKTE